MTIPDPLEIAESQIERWVDQYMSSDGKEFLCPVCNTWKSIELAVPMSPSPYALPICGACVIEKVTTL